MESRIKELEQQLRASEAKERDFGKCTISLLVTSPPANDALQSL